MAQERTQDIDLGITGVAISDQAAKSAFDHETYKALEGGDPHSLTFDKIVDAADGIFATDEEAVKFLERNGGGWTFDSTLESFWTLGE